MRVVPRDDIEMGVGEEGIARRRDLNINLMCSRRKHKTKRVLQSEKSFYAFYAFYAASSAARDAAKRFATAAPSAAPLSYASPAPGPLAQSPHAPSISEGSNT